VPQSDSTLSPELPVLRIVPVASLVVHEHTDPARNGSLVERLQKDGLLRNPPIVSPIPGSTSYVILDGANRATALAQMGCRDAAVQVVDYNDPDLELLAWNHLIIAPSPDAIIRLVHHVSGLRILPVSLEMARGLLVNRGVLAVIMPVEGRVIALEGGLNLEDEVQLLNGVVGAYHGILPYSRVKGDDLQSLLPYYDGAAALVVFPIFQPEEIIRLAAAGGKLPAGITRHVLPQRALRLDIPLAILQADQPLAQKNDWLRDEIKMRLRERRIRFYQEPVVLFDE
jgi:hypothetical protein